MASGNGLQAHVPQTRVTTSVASLLDEGLRFQRQLRFEALWSDSLEIVFSVVMLIVWFYLGFKISTPWTWYLTVLVLGWDIVFTVAYRMHHRVTLGQPDEPLLHCVRSSLTQVEDNIWLQRNIFWLKLLPFLISLCAFFVQVECLKRPQSLSEVLGSVGLLAGEMSVVAIVVLSGYFLAQYTVRSVLEPQRQQLLTLLTSLKDDTTSEV